MSTNTHVSRSDVLHRTSAAPGGKASWAGVMRSEWIKFTSLRSTLVLVLCTVVVMVGFAVLMAFFVGSTYEMISSSPDITSEMGGEAGVAAMVGSVAGSGVTFAQLIIGALAVMVISSEFATGSARSTFTAVPKRQPVFWAKALLVTAVAYILTVLATLAAYLVVSPILSGYGLEQSLTSPVFVRTLWIGSLGVATVAALGFSLGSLLRNSAGGIMSLVALVFVLPNVAMGIPLDWMNLLGRYLPTNAIMQLSTPEMMPDGLDAWQAAVAVAGWIIIPLAAAAFVLQRRDI